MLVEAAANSSETLLLVELPLVELAGVRGGSTVVTPSEVLRFCCNDALRCIDRAETTDSLSVPYPSPSSVHPATLSKTVLVPPLPEGSLLLALFFLALD